MKSWMLVFPLLLAAAPALATDVTNLDKVDHRVLFETSGSHEVYPVAAGDTIHIAGETSGFLSLITAPNPKPSQGTLHADGLLSGVIGAERTERIPADTTDAFVIWPDGTFGVQQHRRGSTFNN